MTGPRAREWPIDDPAAMPHLAALLPGPTGAAALGWTCGVIAGLGPAVIRLTTSQVAFRRRIGFAWLWAPGRWLDRPDSDVVLSIAMREQLESPRWKEVVEPYPGRWMHHLEVPDPAVLDSEVAGWLARAYEQAG